MGQITAGVGLVSGINSTSIINQLIAIDSAPVNSLKTQIATKTSQKTALNDLASKVGVLKTVGSTLSNLNSFQAATTSSSDPSVLTASAANGAAVGTYNLQVAQLVSSQQDITSGFADPNQTKIGAGTLTISQGGGEISSPINLSQLNGGKGVNRSNFRIIDRAGKSATIDISSAVTLNDVAKSINTALNINIRATIGRNGLILQDQNGFADPTPVGQTAPPNLIVQDIGNGTSATELGILGSVSSNTVTGTTINTIGRDTALSQINDGRGIRLATTGNDFTVTGTTGTYSFNLGAAKTIGQIIDQINNATAGNVSAGINSDGNGLKLTDANGGTVTVAALTDSKAAADLGILGSASGTLSGGAIIAPLGTVLVSSLKGGAGLSLGTIGVLNRLGTSSSIDLSGAKTVADILDTINSANAGIKASINQSGSGLQIVDTSGGTNQLKIFNVSGTSSDDLGIRGTFESTTPIVDGGNLHRQYISGNTLLRDINGGKGVAPGKFTVTASDGNSSDIDLTTGNYVTVGDILTAINSRSLGVTASINSNGNGIQLIDTKGGGAQLKVENKTGTSATDLNILGTATAQKIDGAFEKTIVVDANDTLNTVATKINTLGFAVTAAVINDGSDGTPYRLSLNSQNTGLAGRFVFNAGTTKLATQNLVQAQSAAVFIGGSNSVRPLLVTSNSNQITNVIKGVTVNLTNTSKTPVTLSVTRDSTGITKQLQSFTDGFNAISIKLKELTAYDKDTNKAGLLLGDGTAQTIERELYNLVNGVVKNAGRYSSFSSLGIRIGDNAQLVFDSAKFNSVFATDSSAVQSLFTLTKTGLGAQITTSVTKLTDPVNGAITVETKAIDTQNLQFQDRVKQLNDLLSAKKTRLQKQFANMESVLSGLQSQQAALGSLSSLSSINSSNRNSSSSGG